MSEEANADNRPVRPKSHRILAWVVIVLLVVMYIFTLVVAMIGNGMAGPMFMACVGASIVLPGILWFHLRIWQLSVQRTRKDFERFAKKGELSDLAKADTKNAKPDKAGEDDAEDEA